MKRSPDPVAREEPVCPRPPLRRRLAGGLYRFCRGLLAFAMLLAVLVVFTPAGTWLQVALDVTEPPRPADYIVCLGGDDERMIWAAELFRQGLAPHVIVTSYQGAALRMRERIEGMGVPADSLLVDSTSRTTADHPGAIAAMAGVDPANQRFVIVTSVEHSRRAAACFRKGGYRHFTLFAGRTSSNPDGLIPDNDWRQHTMKLPVLLYEYTGLLKYLLAGKI